MIWRQHEVSDDRIREVAASVLSERFGPFGFSGLALKKDKDMDGAAILRMVADVGRKVPAHELITTLLVIQDALEREGEDRTIFLSTHQLGTEELAEDEEV